GPQPAERGGGGQELRVGGEHEGLAVVLGEDHGARLDGMDVDGDLCVLELEALDGGLDLIAERLLLLVLSEGRKAGVEGLVLPARRRPGGGGSEGREKEERKEASHRLLVSTASA